MKKLILLVVMIMFTNIGYTQDCVVRFMQWEKPILNTDGTPAKEIKEYNVYINNKKPISIPTHKIEYEICITRAFSAYVTAVDIAGNESDPSNVIDIISPNTPTREESRLRP